MGIETNAKNDSLELPSNRNKKSLRISRRLSVSLTLTIALVAAIASSIIYIRAVAIEDKALQAKADEFISYLVGAVEIPLWNLDDDAIRLIGKTVSQNELITKMVIFDDSGKILFSFEKDQEDDWVDRKARVTHNGTFIGEIELFLTQKLYRQTSRRLLLSFIIGTVLILICLLSVAGFFIRIFLRKPINSLNKIVTSYSKGNYDASENMIPYHEFKPLGKVLHQMGGKINAQLRSLQRAEEKYRTIYENAVEGIFQTTQKGRLKNVNPAMASILGYDSPEEMLRIIVDIGDQLYVEPAHREELIRQLKKYETVSGFETRMYKKDRSIIWVQLNVRMLEDADGHLWYLEGFLTDISDRNRADQELRRYRDHLEELVTERTDELALAKEQAEAANSAKSDFLARMSHEIRTPLNAVTGLTNVVLKTELTDVQRDYLEKALIASKSLLNVINDILDFSKMEAGQMDLSPAVLDIDQVLESLADLFSNRTGGKDLELIFAASPSVPRQFVGDAGRLSQILTNLIENAIKFTDQGEIVVGVTPGKPKDATKKGSVVLEFRVSDTGMGIPVDMLPLLFKPFTQADSSLTRKHEGTGLGLAICRKLVKLMGGRIWAESTLGIGSTFYFAVSLPTIKDVKHKFKVPGDIHGLKALVVDDSDTARQMLRDLLSSFRFNVSTAATGQEAIEEIRKAPVDEPYQLVLMDWKMPGMDGVVAAKRIRELDLKMQHSGNEAANAQGSIGPPATLSHSSTPIIIMVTAYGQLLVQEQLDTTIADSVLLKPVKPSQLFNTVLELLGRKQGIRPTAATTRTEPARCLEGVRVLVVEDSGYNREVAVAVLEANGMTVDTAENGMAAVEKVIGSKGVSYAAVLMDIQMPVMDGYEATRRIRQWEADVQSIKGRSTLDDTRSSSNGIPIIAVTAHALVGERQKCLAAGMDDYVSKPIVEEELFLVLRNWISPPRQIPQTERRANVRRAQDAQAVLDTDGALQRLGGRRQLYLRVLKKFTPEFSNAPETIKDCVESGDIKTANRVAHSIKGAGAGIGAMSLSGVAADLEMALIGTGAQVAPLLALLEKELKTVLEAISRYLENELDPLKAPATVVKETLTTDQSIHDSLHQLVDFSASGDMRAIAAWEQLKACLQNIGADLMVTEIDQMMERLDFNGASHSLQSLIAYVTQRQDKNDG